MKVTVNVDTDEAEIEIGRVTQRLRSERPGADQGARLRALDALLQAAVSDARRAAGLPAEFEPGALLAAWDQVTRLVGADDPPVSPASVVDRVAQAVNDAKHAGADARQLNEQLLARIGRVYGRDVLAEPPGTVLRHGSGDPNTTMVRLGDEVYLVGSSTVAHPEPEALFEVLHRDIPMATGGQQP